MKKIWILWLAVFCLCGCFETKMIVRSELPVSSELAEGLAGDILAKAPGITPNTVITYTRWLKKNTLAIDFVAYKIKAEPVFGTTINLKYDSNVLKYQSYEKGDFLEQGGEPTGNQKPVYMVSSGTSTEPGMSRLIIGASLFRGTPGVTGSGKLLTLLFKANKDASTEIVFTKSKLKNLQAKTINKIKWPSSIPITP